MQDAPWCCSITVGVFVRFCANPLQTSERTDKFGNTLLFTDTVSPDGTIEQTAVITHPDGGKTTVEQTLKPDGSRELEIVTTTGDGQTTTTTISVLADGT